MKFIRFTLIILSAWLPFSSQADVRLPQLASSGMVLQRQAEIDLWGWAEPGEKVTVKLLGESYSTTTPASGEWRIRLPAMDAGGPHTITVEGNNSLVLDDVLVGDVWLASGQSNMELTMARVEPRYKDTIAEINNSEIRYFDVPDRYDFKQPQQDLAGGHWQPATPEHIRNFSAVGYFFAKDIHDNQDVPVGIINASLGGSPVEAWISEETLKQFPEPYREAQRFKDDALIEQITSQDQERMNAWFGELNKQDQGLSKGQPHWAKPSLKTADWKTMQVPGYWPESTEGPVNGSVWFRKTVEVSKELAGQPAKLILGAIVDADTAFVNGTEVGSTGYQYPPRRYDVPAGVLKAGANTIAIRIISQQGRGGFVLDKDYELQIDNKRIDLTGTWQYKIGATMPPLASQTFVRWKPVGLYNGMIAPLTDVALKGVIWYQGESNVDNAHEYQERFSTMIADWREKWGQDELPFLFVQLANFLEPSKQPGDSGWARLREAQAETLAVPNTAMVVATDVGEWNDIHPLDKKTVGQRLAAAARKLAYDQELVHAGPQYESIQIKGDKAIIKFDHTGSGLQARGGPLQHFAIAGKDRNFVWANAEIRGDTVVVWSDKVKKPQAVRYGWADNPERANLYNKEGFPASPFRTDNW